METEFRSNTVGIGSKISEVGDDFKRILEPPTTTRVSAEPEISYWRGKGVFLYIWATAKILPSIR